MKDYECESCGFFTLDRDEFGGHSCSELDPSSPAESQGTPAVSGGDLYRDIPEHEHTHSLWVRCLNCQMWGIDLPTRFIDAAVCGNCGSLETVKYYPSCCIVAVREDK
jgi:hypothetical protein